jgi:hypothetical protein
MEEDSASDSEKARLKVQVTPEERSSQQDQHSTGTPGEAIVPDPLPVDEFPGVDASDLEDSQCYATSAIYSCTEDQTGRFGVQTIITVTGESAVNYSIF